MSSVTTADVIYVVYLVAPPAITALLIAWIGGRLLPAEVAGRWRLAAGAAAGFLFGYWLLPEWAAIWPERHWQWLPYLAAAAAILGAVQGGGDLRTWERLLSTAVLGVFAAQALTPDWDTLQPPRHILSPLLAVYLLLLSHLLAALPASLRGRSFTVLLSISTLGTATLVGYEVSAKFGQLGAIAAAALTGAALCGWFTRHRAEADSPSASGRDSAAADRPASRFASFAASNYSLAVVYAIVVGGLAFVGMVEPAKPALPLLLAPAAPLTLWLFATAPCSRISGLPAFALKTLAVLLVLATTLGWLLLAAEEETDEWSAATQVAMFKA